TNLRNIAHTSPFAAFPTARGLGGIRSTAAWGWVTVPDTHEPIPHPRPTVHPPRRGRLGPTAGAACAPAGRPPFRFPDRGRAGHGRAAARADPRALDRPDRTARIQPAAAGIAPPAPAHPADHRWDHIPLRDHD